MSTVRLLTSQTEVEYATADDMQKLFVAAMKDLFCLAFLLIANSERAEDCVIRSMRECFRNRYILKERLPDWVRDSVVRNGMKIVRDIDGLSFGDAPRDSIPLVPEPSQPSIGTTDYSAGILELSNFDRLVYVICILERYTSGRCAMLLGMSREQVWDARNRALAHIAEFESRWRDISSDSFADLGMRFDRSRSEFECSCGSLLD